VVAGTYKDISNVEHGFIDAGGSFSTIDPLGSIGTAASGVNDAGTVTGYYTDASGVEHGFIDASGTFSTFGPPSLTFPSSINASDMVTGYYLGSGAFHGFIYADGLFSTIDVPGADSTFSSSINDSGAVTGVYFDPAGVHGFIDAGGTFRTIDVPGAFITYPFSINDSGMVTGYYEAPSAIPESPMWALMIIGIGSLGGTLRLRRRATPYLQGPSSAQQPVQGGPELQPFARPPAPSH
jgi:hypothetical protein